MSDQMDKKTRLYFVLDTFFESERWFERTFEKPANRSSNQIVKDTRLKLVLDTFFKMSPDELAKYLLKVMDLRSLKIFSKVYAFDVVVHSVIKSIEIKLGFKLNENERGGVRYYMIILEKTRQALMDVDEGVPLTAEALRETRNIDNFEGLK